MDFAPDKGEPGRHRLNVGHVAPYHTETKEGRTMFVKLITPAEQAVLAVARRHFSVYIGWGAGMATKEQVDLAEADLMEAIFDLSVEDEDRAVEPT